MRRPDPASIDRYSVSRYAWPDFYLVAYVRHVDATFSRSHGAATPPRHPGPKLSRGAAGWSGARPCVPVVANRCTRPLCLDHPGRTIDHRPPDDSQRACYNGPGGLNRSRARSQRFSARRPAAGGPCRRCPGVAWTPPPKVSRFDHHARPASVFSFAYARAEPSSRLSRLTSRDQAESFPPPDCGPVAYRGGGKSFDLGKVYPPAVSRPGLHDGAPRRP